MKKVIVILVLFVMLLVTVPAQAQSTYIDKDSRLLQPGDSWSQTIYSAQYDVVVTGNNFQADNPDVTITVVNATMKIANHAAYPVVVDIYFSMPAVQRAYLPIVSNTP